MNGSIVWHRSNTMRALLVALAAWGLDKVGLPAEVAQGVAQQFIELILGATQGAAIAWGLYARAKQPTPQLTLTRRAADERNAAEGGLLDE